MNFKDKKRIGGLMLKKIFKNDSYQNPLISIIMPNFKSKKLSSAIISVLNQSYKNIEIIVVDGNSGNQTINVLNNLSGFKTIVPCGLEGESVTSLEKIIGFNCDLMNSVRDQILLHFSNVCDRALQNILINHEIPDFVKKYKPPL